MGGIFHNVADTAASTAMRATWSGANIAGFLKVAAP